MDDLVEHPGGNTVKTSNQSEPSNLYHYHLIMTLVCRRAGIILVLFLGFVGPSRVRVPVPVGEVLGGWCYNFQRNFVLFFYNFCLVLRSAVERYRSVAL